MNHVLTIAVAAVATYSTFRSRDLAKERDRLRRVAARAITKLVIMRIAAEIEAEG